MQQDRKRAAWRMLLDEVRQFVGDLGRWPLRCPHAEGQTYLKEVLLAERLAKTRKEFDEAHLTELQNLQIACKEDAIRKVVEGLVKEVTELGHWLHRDINKVPTGGLQTFKFEELDCKFND